MLNLRNNDSELEFNDKLALLNVCTNPADSVDMSNLRLERKLFEKKADRTEPHDLTWVSIPEIFVKEMRV